MWFCVATDTGHTQRSYLTVARLSLKDLSTIIFVKTNNKRMEKENHFEEIVFRRL